MTRLVVLLAALGANGEDPAVDGDLDVVLRVQAGQFGPDHIVVVPDSLLKTEHLARQAAAVLSTEPPASRPGPGTRRGTSQAPAGAAA